MFFIIGLIIVTASVGIGYGGHGGNFAILWQPFEVVIIVGVVLGAVVIAFPAKTLKASVSALKFFFKGKPYSQADYQELLLFFFKIFKVVKTKGMLAIEGTIENPGEDEIFKSTPSILNNKEVCDFICDYLRLFTMGIDDQHHVEDLIEKELEVKHQEKAGPYKLYTLFGDSLPAIGIVAAVLGVITTMQSISEPPEILGKLIAAALVGTFLGVYLAYSTFGPMANFLGKYLEAEMKYFECIKIALISNLQGNAPTITVEFMRKVIPDSVRPSFQEADEAINNG